MQPYEVSIESLVVSALRKTVWIDEPTFWANYEKACKRAHVLALFGQVDSMIHHLHAARRIRAKTINGVKCVRLA